MGLFDSVIRGMFGRGASKAQQQPNAQQRFDELRQKYQTALNLGDQLGLQFYEMNMQGDRLYIRAVAPSEEVRDRFWEQIRLVNPSESDITTEVTVRQAQAQAAAVGGESSQAGQTYEVQPGDTLSKISRQFYGDANEYMRIYYANRDQLNDPDKIRVGQQLVIPPDDDA